MKRNTKKGFTLVELVIVIAVIAILAAVLIPTFGGIIEKANKSAALQEARNEYAAYLVEAAGTGDVEDNLYVLVDGKYLVQIKDGAIFGEAFEVEAVKENDVATGSYKAGETTYDPEATEVVKTACPNHAVQDHTCTLEYYVFYK